jgi:tyrosyl-tRNA synthetase
VYRKKRAGVPAIVTPFPETVKVGTPADRHTGGPVVRRRQLLLPRSFITFVRTPVEYLYTPRTEVFQTMKKNSPKKRFPPLNEQMDAVLKGTVDVIQEEELEAKIRRSIETGESLRVKQGFDPTTPDLHLGHTVQIRKLKTFQELGHRVNVVIGDFTGMIGDPSGQDETRPRLTREDVVANAQTYKDQIFRILDPRKTSISFNSSWHAKLKFEEVILLASKYTVARMLERDDFEKRYRENRPITIHEFLYPLVQAYDSVALKADVELGGTDQRFNLFVGRDIQREFGQEPQVLVLLPLLVGTDGVRKMSKSLGNYIGITEPPAEIYGKTMSIPDELLVDYFQLLTPLPQAEIDGIRKSLKRGGLNPRDAKRRLARILTAMYHSDEAALDAEQRFDELFIKKEVPDDIPRVTVKWGEPDIWVPRLLAEAKLVRSTSEGRRLIQQGGVSIESRRVEDPDAQVTAKGSITVKVGKRRFARVSFKK